MAHKCRCRCLGRPHSLEPMHQAPANHGWTGKRSKMAMGHLFNHVPAGVEKDINFNFLQLPEDFDERLLTHVPSINARTGSGVLRARWTVSAIAARARSYGDVEQRYTMGIRAKAMPGRPARCESGRRYP